MLKFSDEVQQYISEIQTDHHWRIILAVEALLVMQSTESQTALLSILDQVQKYPDVYWQLINRLDAQHVLDAAVYYHAVLIDETESNHDRDKKEAALRHVQDLERDTAIRILTGALLHLTGDDLIRLTISILAEQCGDTALYRLVLIMRQHPNRFVQRAAAKHMAYRFDASLLIPIALGLIYTDTTDSGGRGTAITLLWHVIIQQKIEHAEQAIIAALKYCMYSLPDLGIMPYRCLMEVNTPDAEAILKQWDAEAKLKDITTHVHIFR